MQSEGLFRNLLQLRGLRWRDLLYMELEREEDGVWIFWNGEE